MLLSFKFLPLGLDAWTATGFSTETSHFHGNTKGRKGRVPLALAVVVRARSTEEDRTQLGKKGPQSEVLYRYVKKV